MRLFLFTKKQKTKQMQKSETLAKIATALLAAQMKIRNVSRSSYNPFYKKNYADLTSVNDECMPHLNEEGIVVLAPILKLDDGDYVETCLLHAESGEYINSLTKIIVKEDRNPQAYGASITYARRYGLLSILNISVEDDDGNTGAGKTKEVEQKPAQKVEQKQAQYTLPVVAKKTEAEYIEEIKKFTTVDDLAKFKSETPKAYWTQKMVVFAKQMHEDIIAGNIKPKEAPQAPPQATQIEPKAESPQLAETKQEPQLAPPNAKGLQVLPISEKNVSDVVSRINSATLEQIEELKKTLPPAYWNIDSVLNAVVYRTTELQNTEEEDLGM